MDAYAPLPLSPLRPITTSPPVSPRDAALATVRTLRGAGHAAYFAGGCVRDALLGREPGDYDVATDATPKRVQRLFRRSKPVGAAFGVVQVYHGHGDDRQTTEVATFRREWGYTDGRRPDHVEFTDAEADARRRDFTVNGLFQDPLGEHGDADHVIDFVGGRADLEAGVIRAIGDPAERLGEDHLRMLRAVRFAARLGFDVEPETAAAVGAHAPRIRDIAPERVADELRRMVEADATLPRAAALLHALALLPALTTMFTDSDADALPRLLEAQPTPRRGWVGFLLTWIAAASEPDRLNPHALRHLPSRLRISNPEAALLRDAAACFDALPGWPTLTTADAKRLAARPGFPVALPVHRAAARAPDADAVAAKVDALAADGIGLAPPPLLTGDTLVAAGFPPGRAMGEILRAVYDRQLEGAVVTTDDALAVATRLRDTI